MNNVSVIGGNTEGADSPAVIVLLEMLQKARAGEIKDFVIFAQDHEGAGFIGSTPELDFPGYLYLHEFFKMEFVYGSAEED